MVAGVGRDRGDHLQQADCYCVRAIARTVESG